MPKKLKLNNLKVQSFKTVLDAKDANRVKGGKTGYGICAESEAVGTCPYQTCYEGCGTNIFVC